ncbi:MAG: hypothetical protein R3B13_24355 [Polyangiaceae bacterium]
MQRWIGCWATVGALVLGTSGAWAQADTKKGEAAATADTKAADAKAGDAKAADATGADAKADPKAADTKAGDAKTDAAAGDKPAETAAPTPAPTAATTGSVDGATYQVRLRELEQRVDELKEQIRRSHTRLSLLSETILSGGVGGARAEIVFTNDMSNIFKLTRALFVLDGAVQYNKQDDTGTLAEQKKIPIFSGSVPPGDHTLQVLLQLRGHGYGVFSYLRGYRFEVKSSHSFTVTEGKTMELEAVAWEKGGVTTPVEQRPAIRYVEKVRSGNAPSSGSGSSSGSDSKSGLSGSFSIGTGGK